VVARDITVGLDGTAEPFVYLPLRQHPRFLSAPRPLVLRVRAESNPSAQAASMRRVLREIDPSLPVTEITTLDAQIAGLLMPQRLGSALLSTLASRSLALVRDANRTRMAVLMFAAKPWPAVIVVTRRP
jgi:hypothetical protein